MSYNIDIDDPESPDYEFSGYTDDTEFAEDDSDDSQDTLADQYSSAFLDKIQERKASFNNFENDTQNVLDLLRTPITSETLIDAIQGARFFAVTERGLINIVQTYICTDTLLANVENMQLTTIYFETALTEVLLTSPKTDTTRIEFLNICTLLRAAVRLILTRTHGAYRERRLQDMNRAEVVTGRLSAPQKQAEISKTPFRIPLGIGKH